MAENEGSLVPAPGTIPHFGAYALDDSFVPMLGTIATFNPKTLEGLAALDGRDDISRNDLMTAQSLVKEGHKKFSRAAEKYLRTNQDYRQMELARQQLEERVQAFQNTVRDARPHLEAAALSAATDDSSIRLNTTAVNTLIEAEQWSKAVITNLTRGLGDAIRSEEARRIAAGLPVPSSHQPHPPALKRRNEDLAPGEDTAMDRPSMAENEDSLVPDLGKIPTFKPLRLAGLTDPKSRDDLAKRQTLVKEGHARFSKAAADDWNASGNYAELQSYREQLKGHVQDFHDTLCTEKQRVEAALDHEVMGTARRQHRDARNILVGVEKSSQAVIANLARPLREAIDIEQARLTAEPSHKRARVESQSEHSLRMDPTPLTAIGRRPTAPSEVPLYTPGIPQSAWSLAPPPGHGLQRTATYPGYEHAPSLFAPEPGPSSSNEPLNVASSSTDDVNSPQLFMTPPWGGLQQPLPPSQPAAARSNYVSELMSWNTMPPQPSSSTQTMGTPAHASSPMTPQVSGPRPQSRGKPRQTPGPNNRAPSKTIDR